MSASEWAIDLGTTHTRVARWDAAAGQPNLLELPELCRQPGGENPLEAPRLVPSATHVIDRPGLLTRIGNLPFLARYAFVGRRAFIGRQALDLNRDRIHPNFASSFKLPLQREPLRPLARAGRETYTARSVARLFVRELLAEIKRATGARIRDTVLTTPVDAYETYRAELQGIARSLGVRRVRFIDEPVAAALGYGLGLGRERLVLVVDFGGGTLHMALASLSARGTEEGESRVLAKAARPVGGGWVDRWLLAELCRRLGFSLSDDPYDEESSFWFRQMLAEARRVKEAVFFQPSACFHLTPPETMRRPMPQAEKETLLPEVTRDQLVEILRAHGLYQTIEACLAEVEAQARADGFLVEKVDDVLMVGGSTLLPGVYPLFENRFGRNRVRAWQPFEAVAFGACAYAAENVLQADFIVHDYAFVTYDSKTNEPQYTVIVPRGTRFPTPVDFWKRQLVPTCSLGEPETLFKLVVCEIGRSDGMGRKFHWDAAGQVHAMDGGNEAAGESEEPIVVPLNEANPTLGRLDPPHSPKDRRPRLEISFGVNEDRWLSATVLDLMTRKFLMRDSPVVRLL